MSRKLYKKYFGLEKKRQQLVIELFSIKKMVQGSFCLIHVKCGKKQCKCNQGELHPHYRMSMRRHGKQVSRAVPKEEHDWIAKATENYREYRSILKAIYKLDDQIKELFEAHEEELVRKTSRGRSYLNIENSEKENEKTSEKSITKHPKS